MPQVASDPSIHAHSSHLPRLPRPAQPSDRAPSPFESLIDDGSQPVDPPAPAPTDNKAAAADGAKAPAKADDSKPASTDAAPAAKPDDEASAETPDKDKPACSGKPAVDPKLADSVTAGETSKPETDKTADGEKLDKPAVTTATPAVQTTNAADAIVVTPPPTPVSTAVPEQGDQDDEKQKIVAAAESGLQLKSLDAGMPKSASGKPADGKKQVDADTQVDTSEPTDPMSDGTQSTTKATQQSHTDKPQFAVSQTDKDHVADARGEAAAAGRHSNADSPALGSADSSAATPKLIADTGAQTTVQATTGNTATNAAAPATLAPQLSPQAAPIPISGVPLEITGKALEGKNRFEIRLDPPELGRIEVRLDVDRDGNVTSRMTVDRADTLDLLRRDASGLERALQDAGLKTADNSLQFSLRDQSMGQQQTNAGPHAAQLIVTDEQSSSIDVIPQNYGLPAGTGGGLDIRV